MLDAERDLTLAIPFDDTLGCCCPKCLSVGIGTQLKDKMRFCPYCGQRLKLISSQRDWQELLKDCRKVPDIEKTNIVTTGVSFPGDGSMERPISGVYLQRLKDYNNKYAQIEGQLSMF